jgi:type IV secretory pathway VirB4 component
MKLGTDISNQQTIDISTDAIRRHLYVVGKSGTGKSVLLEHIIFELLELGWGVCVIDPHGDLAEKIADTIPENRFNDVIYFDPANLEHVIGYNPLTATNRDQRALVADNVLSAFAHVWGLGPHTPRLLHILRNSLRLLLDNRQTLVELQRLLADRGNLTRLLRNVSDPTVKAF